MSEVPSRWKGTCMKSHNSSSTKCNKKLVGARFYGDNDDDGIKPSGSARDQNGHGTHVASTAAGSPISGASYYGLGSGIAKGGFLVSRIAMYRVCTDGGYHESFIMKAFDDAIADRVDVLSLSLGSLSGLQAEFLSDPIAIGAFHAVEKGILVACSAGNQGPQAETVVNVVPWILTVAATIIDRDFKTHIVLGGNKVMIKGGGISFGNLTISPVYPLITGNLAKSVDSDVSRYCLPDSVGIFAISHSCNGVAARACGLVSLEPTKIAEILKDRPSWFRDCRNVKVFTMFSAGSGGTIELLLIPSGYLIRPYDGGGSIMHIVDHLNLESWSAPEILRPLYKSSKDVDGTLVWSTSIANKFVSGQFLNSFYPLLKPQNVHENDFDFGIFLDTLQSRVAEKRNFFSKISYCFWCRLRNLSSLGQDLKTSNFLGEILFTIFICIVGLILLSLLIGNMQEYLQSITVRVEGMRLRRRDAEQWMSNRMLPDNLRERIRRYEQQKWQQTRGVDEDYLISNLPRDLRRDVKRHLCWSLLKRVPMFAKMDKQLLDALCDRLKPTLFTENSFIIQEGDPVNEMLFLTRAQFRRLHSKQLRHTFKFYSQHWRTWAACFVQAAWRRHYMNKIEKSLREEEEMLAVIRLEGHTIGQEGALMPRDSHLLQPFSGTDENAIGACSELVSVPIDEDVADSRANLFIAGENDAG